MYIHSFINQTLSYVSHKVVCEYVKWNCIAYWIDWIWFGWI